MKKLDAEEIFRPNEQNILIGCDGEVHQKVPTTMDVAKERARQGVPDGYIILAERQTNGRGREGAWECSSRSGLLLTIILHANLPPEERHIMGILGPLSATEVFREMGVDAWIKWPNDIVTIESTSPLLLCKMGGTLVEQADRGDGPPDHLLGLGLNVNQPSEELRTIPNTKATSLRIERNGRQIDRNQLCRLLFRQLDQWYKSIRSKDYNPLLNRWRELNCLRGQTIRVRSRQRILTGKVMEMRLSGELVLRSTDNHICHVSPENSTVLSYPPKSDGHSDCAERDEKNM